MARICYTYSTKLPPVLDVDSLVGVFPSGKRSVVEFPSRATICIRNTQSVGCYHVNGSSCFADINLSGADFHSGGVTLNENSQLVLRNGKVSENLAAFLRNSYLRGSTLILLNMQFNDSVYSKVVANHLVSVVWGGTVNFGNETFERARIIVHDNTNNTMRYITVPTSKKNAGFGLVDSAGSVVVLAGKGVMASARPNTWLFTEANEGAVTIILHGLLEAGTTITLANFTFWNDGEPPCFVKVISDTTSDEIWRVVGAPVANNSNLFFNIIAPKFPLKVIRARNQTSKSVLVKEAGVTLAEIPPSENFSWFGHVSLASITTFVIQSNLGTFDLDVEALGRNYYPNYARVLSSIGALPAVTKIVPNFAALPQEHYNVHLNGTLTEMVTTTNKVLYASRTLRNEGVELTLTLDATFSIPVIVERAVKELVGTLNAVKVFPLENTYIVNIFCATKEDEAVLVARVNALLRSFAELFRNLLPPDQQFNFQIKVLHRGEETNEQ